MINRTGLFFENFKVITNLYKKFQHEYMNRLDYQWKRQLKSEQEQARLTKLINKTLLQNILPQHIGKTSRIIQIVCDTLEG
jgi:hypothetical protein